MRIYKSGRAHMLVWKDKYNLLEELTLQFHPEHEEGWPGGEKKKRSRKAFQEEKAAESGC